MNRVLAILVLLTLVGCVSVEKGRLDLVGRSEMRSSTNNNVGIEVQLFVQRWDGDSDRYWLQLSASEANRTIRIQKIELRNERSLLVKQVGFKATRSRWRSEGDVHVQRLLIPMEARQIDRFIGSRNFEVRFYGEMDDGVVLAAISGGEFEDAYLAFGDSN